MQMFLIGLALIASTLAIFLVGRGVACWYWKINRVVSLLENIESRLKSMDSKDQKLLNKMDSLTQQFPPVFLSRHRPNNRRLGRKIKDDDPKP